MNFASRYLGKPNVESAAISAVSADSRPNGANGTNGNASRKLEADDLAERAAIMAEGTGCAPDLADAFALICAATPPPGTAPSAWAAALDRIARLIDQTPPAERMHSP